MEKLLRKYSTHAEYLNDPEANEAPNISLCVAQKEVHLNKVPRFTMSVNGVSEGLWPDTTNGIVVTLDRPFTGLWEKAELTIIDRNIEDEAEAEAAKVVLLLSSEDGLNWTSSTNIKRHGPLVSMEILNQNGEAIAYITPIQFEREK